MNDLVVTRSILLDAGPAKVWHVLTSAEVTKDYMRAEAVSDWKKGSLISWHREHNKQLVYHGRILDIEPMKLLRFTRFDLHAGHEDHPDNYTHICYRLVPRFGKTELVTTLSNFGGNEMRADMAAEEWDFNILPKIKSLSEEPLAAHY
jgi:uncharacterized protein YndB with AHSA1/START domain